MSYAVKIGTNEAWWIDDQATPEGCVRFDGRIPERAVWDESIGNIRQMTEEEIARSDLAPVTAAQFRLALLDAGLLDAVETFVATAPRDIQLNWEYRLEFERSHPLVAATAYALGKTDAELDQLFMLAATK